MSDQLLTCVTCNVGFRESEKQRAHYKTDWHRYNLKRKVAELPPISAQQFAERVQQQKTQIESAKHEALVEVFCNVCSKSFTSKNSYENHMQSKKHKELLAKFDSSAQVSEEKTKKEPKIQPQPVQVEKKDALMEVTTEEAGEEGDNWEDIEDETEEIMKNFDESKGVPLTTCLFCEHKCQSIEAKCEHMAREHSFFIPDADFVSDLEGLVKFLGIKVGVYHVCLWCSSRCYPTLKAVQQHMSDKGHYKMKFEGDTLYEYADFYTYDNEGEAEFETDEEGDEDELEEVTDFVENETYELVLPSGAKIGHRSLFRYYRQNFGHRNLELKQRTNALLQDKYKALGYHNNLMTRSELQKKRKDLTALQRWKSKMHTKIGCNSNKLQKHFRRQDIMF